MTGMTFSMKSLRKLCVAILIAQCVAQTDWAQAKSVTINGRVVSSTRQPVANAVISLRPLFPESDAAESTDGLVAQYTSDSNGLFSIPDAPGQADRVILYVPPPVPPDVYAPISPPFLDLSGGQLINGTVIKVDKDRDVMEVGDVPVNVRFTNLKLLLLNSSGRPYPLKGDDNSPPVLRVRDARGDVVATGAVPVKAIRQDDSSISLALPEGRWTISISFDGADGPWHSVDKPLDLSSSRGQYPPISLKVTGEDEGKPSPPKLANPETARRHLAQLDIPYNRRSFIEHAGKCNVEAVRLFLAAGMSPNAKDKGGDTPLIAAAGQGCGEVVKALLDAGADPNLANQSMTSALGAAATGGSLAAVTALLDKHADPNAKDSEGLTPLILASGNGHLSVVKALLGASADVNARDNKGMTALDYAIQTGEQEIIELLRRSGAQSAKKYSKLGVPTALVIADTTSTPLNMIMYVPPGHVRVAQQLFAVKGDGT
jgi:Ankyrin repeats (3 copies)